MKVITKNLVITEFTLDLAKSVSEISLEEENVKWMPDEVFETEEDAYNVISNLIECYKSNNGPFVYPIFLNNVHIGHIELVQIDMGFEVGYHLTNKVKGNGFASEALIAFLPFIKEKWNLAEVYGICESHNIASIKTLVNSGFTKIFEGEALYHGESHQIHRYIYKF